MCLFFLLDYTVQFKHSQHTHTHTPMNTRTQILPLWASSKTEPANPQNCEVTTGALYILQLYVFNAMKQKDGIVPTPILFSWHLMNTTSRFLFEYIFSCYKINISSYLRWYNLQNHIILYVHCVDLLIWSLTQLNFPFYDFSVIYYDFSKLL